MLLDMAVLAVLAKRYKYVDYSGRAELEEEQRKKAEAKAIESKLE